MAKRSITGSRIILTGASSGIGRALAVELIKGGGLVVATARREERLHELTTATVGLEGKLETVVGDITSPQIRQQLVNTANDAFGGVDIVVNNAGIGALGPFVAADQDRLRQLMEVNFFAPVELIRMALPSLRRGRRPLIVNVSSVLGHRAIADKSEYCASKFALHGFSDALRAELVDANIDVLLVSPSTTSSEFFDSLVDQKGKLPGWSKGGMSPEAVAQATVRAMRRGSHEIILSAGGKALVWFDRLWPWLADKLIAKYG